MGKATQPPASQHVAGQAGNKEQLVPGHGRRCQSFMHPQNGILVRGIYVRDYHLVL